MTIDDIIKSIQSMTTEEIEERLKEIRHNRVMTKVPAKSVKASKVSNEIFDLFNSLSKEEKEKLLGSLGGI